MCGEGEQSSIRSSPAYLHRGSDRDKGTSRRCRAPRRSPRRWADTGLCCPIWACLQPPPSPSSPAPDERGFGRPDQGLVASSWATWIPWRKFDPTHLLSFMRLFGPWVFNQWFSFGIHWSISYKGSGRLQKAQLTLEAVFMCNETLIVTSGILWLLSVSTTQVIMSQHVCRERGESSSYNGLCISWQPKVCN